MSLFTMMIFASTALAAGADDNGTAGGDVLTITGGTTAGPALTFTPSPSTLITVFTAPTEFTATAASAKTTMANGIEYGIDSDTSDMYQMVQGADNDVTDADAADALPSTFETKAGVAAPTS